MRSTNGRTDATCDDAPNACHFASWQRQPKRGVRQAHSVRIASQFVWFDVVCSGADNGVALLMSCTSLFIASNNDLIWCLAAARCTHEMCIRALFNHWIVDGRLDVVMFAVHKRCMEWVAFDAHFPICLLFLPIYFSFVRSLACMLVRMVFWLVFWLRLHTINGMAEKPERVCVCVCVFVCARERGSEMEKSLWCKRAKKRWMTATSIEWAFGVKLWLYWLCGRYTEVNYKRNIAACNTYTHTQIHIADDRERES